MFTKTHITKKNISIEYCTLEDGTPFEKCCLKCGLWKKLTEFSRNKTCFLCLHNWCKLCAKTRAKEQRKKLIVTPKKPILVAIDNVVQRRCTKCGFLKSIETEFDHAPSGFMGHDSECKECKRRRSELYRRNKGIRAQRRVPILSNEQGDITHRECARCYVMLPLAAFNKHGGGSAYLGIHPYCKPCDSDRTLIAKYGITSKDKARMHQEQDESCAICKETIVLADIHVDHCHTTGKVRGLLCGACNKAIGLLKDDPKRCIVMAEYLSDPTKNT